MISRPLRHRINSFPVKVLGIIGSVDKIEIAKWLPAWNGRESVANRSEAYALLDQSDPADGDQQCPLSGVKRTCRFAPANVCFQSGH